MLRNGILKKATWKTSLYFKAHSRDLLLNSHDIFLAFILKILLLYIRIWVHLMFSDVTYWLSHISFSYIKNIQVLRKCWLIDGVSIKKSVHFSFTIDNQTVLIISHLILFEKIKNIIRTEKNSLCYERILIEATDLIFQK